MTSTTFDPEVHVWWSDDDHPGWRAVATVRAVTFDGRDDDEGTVERFVSDEVFAPHDPDGGLSPVAVIYRALDDVASKARCHVLALEETVGITFKVSELFDVHTLAWRAAVMSANAAPVTVAAPPGFLGALLRHAQANGNGHATEEDVTPSRHAGHYL